MSSAISSPLAAVCDDLDRGVHALVNVAVVGVCAGFGEGEAVRLPFPGSVQGLLR
jgi:hypothetical protein